LNLKVEFNCKYEGQYITYICLCSGFNINLSVRYKDNFLG